MVNCSASFEEQWEAFKEHKKKCDFSSPFALSFLFSLFFRPCLLCPPTLTLSVTHILFLSRTHTHTHIYTFPLPIFLIFLRTEQLGTWYWFPSEFGHNLVVAKATHVYLFCLFCILVWVFPLVREWMWNGDDKCAQVEQQAVMHVCVYVCK